MRHTQHFANRSTRLFQLFLVFVLLVVTLPLPGTTLAAHPRTSATDSTALAPQAAPGAAAARQTNTAAREQTAAITSPQPANHPTSITQSNNSSSTKNQAITIAADAEKLLPVHITTIAEESVTLVNTSKQTRTLSITNDKVCPPLLNNQTIIFIPLIQTSSVTSTAQITPTIPITAQESDVFSETIILQPGTQASYTLSEADTYYVCDLDNLEHYTVITAAPETDNQAPITYPATVNVASDSQATINLAHEAASDPDNDPLTFELDQNPAHGQASILTDTLIYTPDPGYTGNDNLTFQTNDDHGHRTQGTITINVVAHTSPPMAGDAMVSISQGDTATLDVSNLVENTTGQSLEYFIEVDGDYGIATLNTSILEYKQTTTTTYTNVFTDSVIYGLTTPQGEQSFGTILVRILPEQGTLQANDRIYPIYVNTSHTIDLARLVDNPAGSSLTFEVDTTIPFSGSTSLQGSRFTFTPGQDYTGLVGFSYRVTATDDTTDDGQILFDVRAPLQAKTSVDTTHPVRLIIEPSSVMFNQIGQTATLKLRAYNYQGEEVPLTGAIYWMTITQDQTKGVDVDYDPANPTEATVTARRSVGYAQIKARWDGIRSRSSVIMAAEFQEDVLMVPTDAVVEPVSFALPDNLAAQSSRSAQLAWLRAQGPDYSLPPRFRTVLDTSNMERHPQTDDLINASGGVPIVGRVIATNSNTDGTEIIYETVPITTIVKRASFAGSFGPEDYLTDIQGALQTVGPPQASIGSRAAGSVALATEHNRPQQDTGSIGDVLFPLKKTFGDDYTWSERFDLASFTMSRSRYGKHTEASTTNNGSCFIDTELRFDFTVSVAIDIDEGFLFDTVDVTFSQDACAGAKAKLTCEASSTVHLALPSFKTNLPAITLVRLPIFPLLGISFNFNLEANAGLDATGEMKLTVSKDISFATHATISTNGTASADASGEGFDPSVEVKLQAKVTMDMNAKVQAVPGFLVGITDMEVLRRWLRRYKDIKLPDWVPDLTVGANIPLNVPIVQAHFATDPDTTKSSNGKTEINNAFYGSGSYSFGVQGFVQPAGGIIEGAQEFLEKLPFSFSDVKLTEPILIGEAFAKYPLGWGKPDNPADDSAAGTANIPENICKRKGPDGYKNGSLHITCKQERTENADNSYTINYYRKTAYQNVDDVQRTYTFEESLFDSHVKNLEVYVIEEAQPGDGPDSCQPKKVFRKVGTINKTDKAWKWSWNNIPKGRYKLVSFTNPLGSLLGFYINDGKGFFSIGAECVDESEKEKGWVLVDSFICQELDEDCAPTNYSKNWGDPHLNTFDGISYTTFELGEFIYAQDPRTPDGFALQARQEKLREYGNDWASYITASVLRTGGYTFELRLPPDQSFANMELLIDGERSELPANTYDFDGTRVDISSSNAITIWATVPVTPSQSHPAPTATVRVAFSPFTIELNWASDIELPFQGMLGNYDGNNENDLTDRQGNVVASLDELHQAWRITRTNQSLFTYRPGEGPDTFNKARSEEPPTYEELQQDGFIQQARDLLGTSCKIDPSLVHTKYIHSIAIDLAAGLSPGEVVTNGACDEERIIQIQTNLVDFDLNGAIQLIAKPDIGLPDVEVSIRIHEFDNRTVCHTYTDSNGIYSCRFNELAATVPTTLTLDYTIRGTSPTITATEQITTSLRNTSIIHERNFQADFSDGITPYAIDTFAEDAAGWGWKNDAPAFRYNENGGNLGGHICADEIKADGLTWYFRASSQFLERIPNAYGKLLTFDIKQTGEGRLLTPSDADEDVWLEGGDTTLVFDTATLPGHDWTSYEVPLIEEGWTNRATGEPATQAEMQTVLANLVELLIRGEYRSGPDSACLDNVALEELPQMFTIVSDEQTEYYDGENWQPSFVVYFWSGWATIEEASWVWRSASISEEEAENGSGPIQFRRQFTLPTDVQDIRGKLHVSADNAYEISINGKLIGSNSSGAYERCVCQDIYTYDVDNLQPGVNELTVVAENNGKPNSSNPGGVVFRVDIRAYSNPN